MFISFFYPYYSLSIYLRLDFSQWISETSLGCFTFQKPYCWNISSIIWREIFCVFLTGISNTADSFLFLFPVVHYEVNQSNISVKRNWNWYSDFICLNYILQIFRYHKNSQWIKEQTFYCFLLFLLSFKTIKLLTQHCFTTNIDVLSNFDYLKLISLFSKQNCLNRNNRFSIIPTIHSFYCVFEFSFAQNFHASKIICSINWTSLRFSYSQYSRTVQKYVFEISSCG